MQRRKRVNYEAPTSRAIPEEGGLRCETVGGRCGGRDAGDGLQGQINTILKHGLDRHAEFFDAPLSEAESRKALGSS